MTSGTRRPAMTNPSAQTLRSAVTGIRQTAERGVTMTKTPATEAMPDKPPDPDVVEEAKRVLVCGTRDGLHEDGISLLRRRLGELIPCIVIEGGARGVDRQARGVAESAGVAGGKYPAGWGAHSRAAGSIRNQQMLDTGIDLVLAFPGPDSRGTWDMVRRAERAGVPVE